MSGKTLALIMVLGGLCVGAPSNAQAKARRTTTVTVDGDRIALGDVSPTAPLSLLAIDIAPAPAPGGKAVISRSAIRAALARAGADPHLADGLPSKQIVRRASNKLTPKTLEPLVIDALAEHLPVGVSVADVRGLESANLPHGDLEVRVRPGRLRRSTTVSVLLHVDSRLVARQSAVVTLAGEARTPTLRADLPRGSVVDADDVTYKTTPIDKLPNRIVTRGHNLVGKRLTQPGRAGRPIQRSAVQTPPTIERGARIRLVAKMRGLSISRLVTATEDGRIGETIRVKPQNSRETLEATVHSATEVRVPLGATR